MARRRARRVPGRSAGGRPWPADGRRRGHAFWRRPHASGNQRDWSSRAYLQSTVTFTERPLIVSIVLLLVPLSIGQRPGSSGISTGAYSAACWGCRRSLAGRPYRVVRCSGIRPAPRMISCISSAQTCWPCTAPAARVMDSSISTPPMSLAPACKAERRAVGAHLHPGGLDIGDERVQRQSRDGMHQKRLAEGRALARLALR